MVIIVVVVLLNINNTIGSALYAVAVLSTVVLYMCCTCDADDVTGVVEQGSSCDQVGI